MKKIFLAGWLLAMPLHLAGAAPTPAPTKKLVSKTVLLVVAESEQEATDLASGLRQIGLQSQLTQDLMPIVRFSSGDSRLNEYMVRLGFDNGARPLVAVVEWSDETDAAGPKKISGGSVFREVKVGDAFTLQRAVDHWKFRTGRLSELPESKEPAQIVIQSLEAEPMAGGKASIRLRMQNAGKLTVQGPVTVTLLSRPPGGSWSSVQTLQIDKILAGNVVTREMVGAATQPTDFKAEISVAGQNWAQEVQLKEILGSVASIPVARSAPAPAPAIPTAPASDLMPTGRAFYSAGKYGDAVATFTQVLATDPKNSAAYLYRGLARFQLQDYQNSIGDFTEALNLDPKVASTYSIRAVARMQLNDLSGALADYNKLIELEPGNARGYRDRGWLKKRLGDAGGASQDLDKARSLDPTLRIEQ